MKKVAFTIVLNGMPFIKQQYEIIPKLFDEWYIVEGVAAPRHDTSWCRQIDHTFFNEQKLSVDGTTEFLDSIVSDKIHVIRKGDFWDGKLEMCNSFMHNLENCILMQFDVDELWSLETLTQLLDYAVEHDHYDGMLFSCNFFVGKNLKLELCGGYADSGHEWRRLWKIRDKTSWLSHEPPAIHGCDNYLDKTFTSSMGWVFNHYAYVIEDQVRFKENFYGYENAVQQWRDLQQCTSLPCQANHYLKWIRDSTRVIKC